MLPMIDFVNVLLQSSFLDLVSSSEHLLSSAKIHISQQTDYPWSGNIRFEIQTAGKFGLYLRKLGWCEAEVTLTVNEEIVQPEFTSGNYIRVEREWKTGDILELGMPMFVRKMASHPFVVENQGRVALMRGPLVYCLENIDHSIDVRLIALPASSELKDQFHPELLGGVVALHGEGRVSADKVSWGNKLYKPFDTIPPVGSQTVSIMVIPYYAWANLASCYLKFRTIYNQGIGIANV